VLAVIGATLMTLVMTLLDRIGAPSLVAAAPWYLPTIAALVWNLGRPKPGLAGQDGDESWLVYSIRAVMVGAERPKSRPARAITAVLFGAPVAWCLLVVGVLALAGVV
jgi:hypothetical protein